MSLHRQLLLPIIFLFVIGLLMIFNTSSAEALELGLSKSTHLALIKQMIYGVLGFVLGLITYRVGYKKLLELSPQMIIGLSIALLLVFVPGLGVKANGARRWISLFGISIQPSEFMKYVILLFFSHRILLLQQLQTSTTLKDFFKILGVIAVPLILILLEPNNGTVIVILTALTALFFLTRIPFNYWAAPMLGIGLVISAFALQLPYVKARLEVYLHPELDLRGKGHQPHQAKIASGSGGLFGKGPGKSLQKLSYLPEAQNDYIAAIYAEETGFIGIFVLIAIYGWITYLGMAIGLKTEDPAGLYVAASFTFLMTFQAFLNLGVVSGLLPSTGLNLPFFSQGGSSLVGNAFGLGILMSVGCAQEKTVSSRIKKRGAYV